MIKYVENIKNKIDIKYDGKYDNKPAILFYLNLFSILILVCVIFILLILNPGISIIYYLGISALILFQLAGIILNSTGHFNTAVYLTINTNTVIVWLSIFYNYVYGNQDAFQTFYITLTILLSSVFLSRKTTIIFTLVQFISLIVFILVYPELTNQNITTLMAFIITSVILIDLFNANYKKQLKTIKDQNQDLILKESKIRSINAKLEESEKRFRALFENAPFGYQSLDSSGNFIEVNTKWLDLFGYKKEEVIGKWFGDFLVEGYQDLFRENFQKFIKDRSIHSEFPMITKSGNVIQVGFDGKIGLDKFDHFKQTHCTVTDITEINMINDKLRYEKELAQRYLNLAGVMIVVLDRDGNVTLINKKGCEVIGLEEDEIVGKNWFDNFIHKSHIEEIKNVFYEVFNAKSSLPAHHENTIVNNNGEERLISWNNSILFDASGNPSQVISAGDDITEERQKIEEIKYLNFHDVLTGLHNRRYYEERVNYYEDNKIYPLTLIMADVNGLKLINDAFGHQTGDALLKKSADLLSSSFSEKADVCRIGGDEFVIILSGKNQAKAEQLVQKIKQEAKNITVENTQLSISFGIATRENDEMKIDELFKMAEDDMYQAKLVEVPSMHYAQMERIMSTLEEKDPYVEEHVAKVAVLAEAIAKTMNLSQSDMNTVKAAGMLHDIGKIIIPNNILNKPGRLTNDEYEIVKDHSEIGYRILNSSSNTRGLADIVLYHHERWDGKGYPKGLSKTEIPLLARIICVADAFDAMISYRSYTKTKTKKEAL